jgi:hypothetical protein
MLSKQCNLNVTQKCYCYESLRLLPSFFYRNRLVGKRYSPLLDAWNDKCGRGRASSAYTRVLISQQTLRGMCVMNFTIYDVWKVIPRRTHFCTTGWSVSVYIVCLTTTW